MQTYPFALRLIGFDAQQTADFRMRFAAEQSVTPGYYCLHEDSLQDPDLYLVNGLDPKALASLSGLNPGAAQPALLIGKPSLDVPWPWAPHPVVWEKLLQHLAILVGVRADSISRLAAHELVSVPDRRRRPRIDFDLTDQSEYIKMRRPAVHGGVLLVDHQQHLCDQLNELLSRYHLAADQLSRPDEVMAYCNRNPVGVVLLNTNMGFDPYAMCRDIKQIVSAQAASQGIARRCAVILLLERGREYDSEAAHAAGAEGMLDKPIAINQVMLVLKKFISMGR
ncbi:response regulator [Massilia sp. W12]|uniref:response regulator n=1 Tax=Massilia sp. W12 TaxID=3126507 RepID=UPI0030D326D2